jgi:N-methylhydantoinase A
VFDALEREVVAALVAEGAQPASIRCERTADMRYRGQEHAVRVPVPPGAVSAAGVEADFHALHRQKYTFDLEGDPVEIVTCHVAAFGGRPPLPSPVLGGARPGSSPTPKGRRRVDFDADGVYESAVYDRTALPVGFRASGPLVVEDETTTALVHPGQTLEVDEAANLLIHLR